MNRESSVGAVAPSFARCIFTVGVLIALSGCAGVVSGQGSIQGERDVTGGIEESEGDLLAESVPGETVPCLAPSASPAPDLAAEATRASAMDEGTFWGYIEELRGTTDPDGFESLTDKLAELTLSELVAFDARLTLSLYELDSGCRAEWYRLNEPEKLGFVSDDVFLYARADTIAAGREVWSEALATETLPWGKVDPSSGYGEFLLYVGADAADAAGLDLDEFYAEYAAATEVSYETGSNPAGWPVSTK
jgi:hypothetical protein